MANPLQPKCVKILEQEYNAFVIVTVSTSKSGIADIIACIDGMFYAFEIKWGDDKPSELQKQKINEVIDSGGKAYFITSENELRYILDSCIAPIRYSPKVNIVI